MQSDESNNALVTTPSDTSSLMIELSGYLAQGTLAYDSDPLLWWSGNDALHPNVSKTAASVLSITASSAPVERIFSTAGKIFRPERTRLIPETFETLVFIKCNKHFLQE